MVRLGAGLLVFLGLLALWVWQCSGPSPSVSGVELDPPEEPGGAYVVQATLTNDRWAHGTVKVIFQITEPESGRSYREEKEYEVGDGEEMFVSAEIEAPEAAYEPAVWAEYPVK
jgi:hypothetical protein